MALVSFKRGTKPADVSSLDGDTIYFFSDTKEIYLGSTPYAGDLTTLISRITKVEGDITSLTADVESAESDILALQAWKTTHEQEYEDLSGKYDELEAALEKKIASLAAGDASITVSGTETAKTVKVAISSEEDNLLTLEDDGLYVATPESEDYTVAVTTKGTANEGMAKTYVITQEASDLNFEIDIPKDLVVSSGTIVNQNGSGASGTFIKLVLNNNDEIYIDVADLVDLVEANNGENPVVSITVTDGHKVAATLNTGTVTKEHLVTAVQTTLTHADEAYAALTWGTL